MNPISKIHVRPLVICPATSIVGLTTPECQEFASNLIKAIGRATKKSFKATWGWIVRVFREVDRKWTEAGEADRRIQDRIDDHYARRFHHLRCSL